MDETDGNTVDARVKQADAARQIAWVTESNADDAASPADQLSPIEETNATLPDGETEIAQINFNAAMTNGTEQILQVKDSNASNLNNNQLGEFSNSTAPTNHKKRPSLLGNASFLFAILDFANFPVGLPGFCPLIPVPSKSLKPHLR